MFYEAESLAGYAAELFSIILGTIGILRLLEIAYPEKKRLRRPRFGLFYLVIPPVYFLTAPWLAQTAPIWPFWIVHAIAMLLLFLEGHDYFGALGGLNLPKARSARLGFCGVLIAGGFGLALTG